MIFFYVSHISIFIDLHRMNFMLFQWGGGWYFEFCFWGHPASPIVEALALLSLANVLLFPSLAKYSTVPLYPYVLLSIVVLAQNSQVMPGWSRHRVRLYKPRETPPPSVQSKCSDQVIF